MFLKGEDNFYEGAGKSLALEQSKEKDICYDKCVAWDSSDEYIYRFNDTDFMCCEFIMMQNGRTACNLYHEGQVYKKDFPSDLERKGG